MSQSDFVSACYLQQQMQEDRIDKGFENLDLLKAVEGGLTRDKLIEICREAYSTGYLRGHQDGLNKGEEMYRDIR